MKGIAKAAVFTVAAGALVATSAAVTHYMDTKQLQNATGSNISASSSESSASAQVGGQPAVSSSEVSTTESSIDKNDWRLLLVNPSHSIPEGYQPELEYVQGKYQMDARAADDMKQMIADAKKDGINLWVLSSYRTQEYQEGLFNDNVRQLKAQGMTEQEAITETAANVAVPGTSEHQTGLAADIMCAEWTGGITEDFAETEAYAWLKAHCAEYGFIERFPKGKSDITKIVYEPWHYRYVGVEHATAIMEQGITLEEYLGVR